MELYQLGIKRPNNPGGARRRKRNPTITMGMANLRALGTLGNTLKLEILCLLSETRSLTAVTDLVSDNQCKSHVEGECILACRFDVPDVDAACKRFEELGVKFVKKPNDGKMKGIAFIQVGRGLLATCNVV